MHGKPKISLSKHIVIIDKVNRLLNDPVLHPTPPLPRGGNSEAQEESILSTKHTVDNKINF